MDSEASSGAMVTLKVFQNEAEAAFAASRLDAAGIKYLIQSDDAGGMYPIPFSAGGALLRVNCDDAAKAREILDRGAAASVEPTVPRPVDRRFPFLAFLLGVLTGVSVYWAIEYQAKQRDVTYEYDRDGDGKIDERSFMRQGQHFLTEIDCNFDGVFDVRMYYENGLPTLSIEDGNLDGKPDGWCLFQNGVVTSLSQDNDNNGVVDRTCFYIGGIPFRADMRPNGSSKITLRSLYQDAVVREELRDTDGDGYFDLSVKYDPFYTPVQTNHIRVPYESIPAKSVQ